MCMQSQILFSASDISGRVRALGAEISEWARGFPEPPVMLWLAEGAVVFAADLMREIGCDMQVASLKVSSYGASLKSSGTLRYSRDFCEFAGKNILLVDDISDTGLTLREITGKLKDSGALQVKTCTLLCKPGKCAGSRRPDFVGFDAPDSFVFGYGLDFSGRFRNLPDIRILTKE